MTRMRSLSRQDWKQFSHCEDRRPLESINDSGAVIYLNPNKLWLEASSFRSANVR